MSFRTFTPVLLPDPWMNFLVIENPSHHNKDESHIKNGGGKQKELCSD